MPMRNVMPGRGSSHPPAEAVSFAPLLVAQLDLDAGDPRVSVPVAPATPSSYERARLLVRVCETPVGFVDVEAPDGFIDPTAAAASASSELGSRIDRARDRTRTDDADGDAWSVVLCTRDRPEGARATIESLLALRPSPSQVVVVDNAPSDEATSALVAQIARESPSVLYVHEPRPGLAVARNRGVREANGELLAFTDDDVRVDRGWLQRLSDGLGRDARIGCVTGLVASASLAEPAEQYFDRRVWWSSSCEPRLFTPAPAPADSALHPYSSGRFGTGANFAVRREALSRLGGFDEALGTGTPSRGGEDLDLFVRLLLSGQFVSYEPSALVWHSHRVDRASLKRQMYGYGVGLSAYLSKYLIDRSTRREIARRGVAGARHLRTLARRSTGADVEAGSDGTGGEDIGIDARALLATEARGLLDGPLAYRRARRAQDPGNLAATSPTAAIRLARPF